MKNKPIVSESIRILFVVSRILRDDPDPYYSIVMRLINGLCKNCRTYFHLEVLQPPTYEQLAKKLSHARVAGKPYHILHFEGLGTYGKPSELNLKGNVIPLNTENNDVPSGYLLFENITRPDVVRGDQLGQLLVENQVSVVSLASPYGISAGARDQEDEILRTAYEAVMRACLSAGVLGAIGMPCNGGQDASAKFFGDLYAALAQGSTLSEAAATVQKLYLAKLSDAKSLQVRKLTPSVLEPQPCRLTPKIELVQAPIFRISLVEKGKELLSDRIDRHLARRLPSKGTFGRDRVMLMLERAFNYQGIVVLHGEDGSGKTVAAAEFARWQTNVGAIGDNPVLYTSFETCLNVTDVLESFGQVYEQALLERHVTWSTLDDFQRQKLIQDVLKKVPLLWIWDDFEGVADSWVGAWNRAEQKKLVEWIQSLAQTGLRLLILSRTEEKKLLGDLPLRLPIPSLLPFDLRKIADIICKEQQIPQSQRITSTWQDISGSGNPQALILAVKSPAETGDFSLNRIVEHHLARFSPSEQRLLACCGLFRGILNLDILRAMGDPAHAWHLPELSDFSGVKAAQVFERAASLGLVESIAGRYYLLQPALVQSLSRIFRGMMPVNRPLLAFVASMSAWCRMQVSQYESWNQQLLGLFNAEEGNIRNALALAHQNGWDDYLVDLLAALKLILTHSRRYASWEAILDQVAQDFINLKTGKPRRRRQKDWLEFLDDRVEIAQKRERFYDAVHWQQIRVDWERARLKQVTRSNTSKEKGSMNDIIQCIAFAMSALGHIYQEAGKPEACSVYEDAFQLMTSFDQLYWAGVFATDIAVCYLNIPGFQNLDLAGEWIERSLALRGEADTRGRSQCLALRGKVALEKFLKSQKENRPEAEMVGYLNQSLGHYFNALDILPEDALADLGAVYEALGYLYLQTKDALGVAMEYYDQAILCKKEANDHLGASLAGFNVAVALSMLNQMDRVRSYATEALRGFEAIGLEAEEYIQKTRGLIARVAG